MLLKLLFIVRLSPCEEIRITTLFVCLTGCWCCFEFIKIFSWMVCVLKFLHLLCPTGIESVADAPPIVVADVRMLTAIVSDKLHCPVRFLSLP